MRYPKENLSKSLYLEIDVAEVVIVASPQKQMNRYLDDLMEKTMIYYSPKKKKPETVSDPNTVFYSSRTYKKSTLIVEVLMY